MKTSRYLATFFLSLLFFTSGLLAEIPEYKAALQKYKEQNYEESLNLIRSVFDANRKSLELRLLAAANYMAQGNTASARDHIKYSIQDHPKAWQPRALLAAMYRMQGNPGQAVRIAGQAIQISGDNVHLRLEIAAAYLQTGQAQKAQAHLARALEQEPRNFNALYMDGMAWLLQGNLENAEFRFRNAMESPVPGKMALANLYANMAYTIEKQIDAQMIKERRDHAILKMEEARKYNQLALASNPEHKQAKQGLARLKNLIN